MSASLLSDLATVARLDAYAAERSSDDSAATYLHELADAIEDEVVTEEQRHASR